LKERVGVQCHGVLVVICKLKFHGSQSLPVEAAVGREARIKPIARINGICCPCGGVDIVVRPAGIFLALPIFTGISLQVVYQFGVSCCIKGNEGGGRIKVDLNFITNS
jgi:hypothetical protein